MYLAALLSLYFLLHLNTRSHSPTLRYFVLLHSSSPPYLFFFLTLTHLPTSHSLFYSSLTFFSVFIYSYSFPSTLTHFSITPLLRFAPLFHSFTPFVPFSQCHLTILPSLSLPPSHTLPLSASSLPRSASPIGFPLHPSLFTHQRPLRSSTKAGSQREYIGVLVRVVSHQPLQSSEGPRHPLP